MWVERRGVYQREGFILVLILMYRYGYRPGMREIALIKNEGDNLGVDIDQMDCINVHFYMLQVMLMMILRDFERCDAGQRMSMGNFAKSDAVFEDVERFCRMLTILRYTIITTKLREVPKKRTYTIRYSE